MIHTSKTISMLNRAWLLSGGDDAPSDSEPSDTAHQSPETALTITPPSPPAPGGDGNTTVVTLDASASENADGDALGFSWDVGSTTYVEGTSESREITKVMFPGVADYPVTLTVTDENGASDKPTGVVRVE